MNKDGIPRAPDLFYGDSDQARRLPPVPSVEEMGIKWTIAQQEKKNKLSLSTFAKTTSKSKRGSKRRSVLHSIGLMARKSKIELEDVVKAVPQPIKTEFIKKHQDILTEINNALHYQEPEYVNDGNDSDSSVSSASSFDSDESSSESDTSSGSSDESD